MTGERGHWDVFRRQAAARHAECIEAPTEGVFALTEHRSLAHWIRRDNLELVFTVCESAKADLPTALDGMYCATPPQAAWTLRRIARHGREVFVLNAFAANDPESTRRLIREAVDGLNSKPPLTAAFNHRRDRAFRVESFAPLSDELGTERLFLIGDPVPGWQRLFPSAVSWAGKRNASRIIDQLLDAVPPGAPVAGMGNIGGPGLELVDLMEQIGELV